MDARYKLYCEFKDAYISAHCDLKSDQALKNAQQKWNETKNNTDEVKNQILTWRAKAAEKKSRLLSMWARAVRPKDQPDVQPTSLSSVECPSASEQDTSPQTADVSQETTSTPTDDTVSESTTGDESAPTTKRSTPAQDAARQQLNSVNSQMASLLQLKNTGLWTDDMNKQSQELKERKTKLEQKLKRLAAEQIRKQTARVEFKRKLTEVPQRQSWPPKSGG